MAEAKDEAGGRALELGKEDQGGCAQSGCHWAAERNGYCWAHQVAPTAESGPAPVDEAPERVTADQAWILLTSIMAHQDNAEQRQQMRRFVHQQEQSEREVASLQMRLGEALGMLHEADGHNTQPATWEQLIAGANEYTRQNGRLHGEAADLQEKLTAAERKAEGLEVQVKYWTDAYEQREKWLKECEAKLAESERKLADVRKVASDVAAQRNAYQCQLLELQEEHGLPRVLRSATEPAGVEADNADPTPTEPEAQPTWYVVEEDGSYNECATVDEAGELLDCATEEAYITTRKPEMPAPTETEAPARFRVGQRVLRKSHIQDGVFFVRTLGETWARIEQLRKNGAYAIRVSLREIEPYDPIDPAPPKPGAAKLTGPVEAFRAELCQALETSGNEAMKWLARELRGLEREGGGKS